MFNAFTNHVQSTEFTTHELSEYITGCFAISLCYHGVLTAY